MGWAASGGSEARACPQHAHRPDAPQRDAQPKDARRKEAFRQDIQGLRAVACWDQPLGVALAVTVAITLAVTLAPAPGSAPLHGHDVDRLGQALQGLAPGGRHVMALPDGPGTRHDLARAGDRGDPRRLVDALAAEVALDAGSIGGVEPDPDLGREARGPAMLGEPALDRHRGLDGLVG